jgi:hypothetical protein
MRSNANRKNICLPHWVNSSPLLEPIAVRVYANTLRLNDGLLAAVCFPNRMAMSATAGCATGETGVRRAM